MEMQTDHITLSEIRQDDANTTDSINLKKNFLGGYKVKEVTEYINTLKDNLRKAEQSFKNRLEEYSSMTSMLTQERDKYHNLLIESDEKYREMQKKIFELTAENDELKEEINKISENVLTENEVKMYEETLNQNIEMSNKIEDLSLKLKEYEDYKYDNIKLKSNIEQLESIVEEQNKKIDDYSKNEITNAEYQAVISENQLIKQQNEEVMTEISKLTAENNMLDEQNNRLKENLEQAFEKIKETRDDNTKIKIKARKIIADFETKIYEYSESRKKNIDQISDSLKAALNVLYYENINMIKLLNGPQKEFSLDNDNEEKALNNALNDIDSLNGTEEDTKENKDFE